MRRRSQRPPRTEHGPASSPFDQRDSGQSFAEFLAFTLFLGFSYRHVFPLHTGAVWSWVEVVAWCVTALITVWRRFINIRIEVSDGEEW